MPKRTTDHAAAAKLIRAELKKHGISARVRSRFDAIRIKVEDQPPATIEAIKRFCAKFEAGHFNPMIDCYEYTNHRDDVPQVRFIFIDNDYSIALRAEAWDWIRAHLSPSSFSFTDGPIDLEWPNSDDRDMLHRTLHRDDFGFWTARKPRVRAA